MIAMGRPSFLCDGWRLSIVSRSFMGVVESRRYVADVSKRDERRAFARRSWWAGEDSNLRRCEPTGLQPVPFGRSGTDPTAVTLSVWFQCPKEDRRFNQRRGCQRLGIFLSMGSFDVVSQIDMQEVRNAVDQAAREVSTRYDFKDTGSEITLTDVQISLASSSEDRLLALRQVLEEKLVRRKVSLKALEYGEVEEASGASVRQQVVLQAGISSDKAKELNKFIKGLGIKGVQSQTQGDQLRVNSKKRDHLQTVISKMKEADFELPLQFENFRD